MKRLSITSLLSTATLILATVAIVSCTPGSDNKPHGKKELTTTIKVEASDDLIAASDIEITYKGKGGIDVTDTITSTRWQKKIVNDSFPTEIGIVNYRMLIKPDAKLDKERCQLSLELKCMCKSTSFLKIPIFDWSEKPIDIDDIASSKVPAYLEMQELTPGLFNGGFMEGFHSLIQKVSINNGEFEVNDAIINAEEQNEQEPSKETER